MNPKSQRFTRRPCIVCGYPFSDRHHLYPKRNGGTEITYLCPNHHRYANMLQIVIKNHGVTSARDFAQKYFDKEFNDKVLESLIGEYDSGQFADIFSTFFGGR